MEYGNNPVCSKFVEWNTMISFVFINKKYFIYLYKYVFEVNDS